MSRGIRTVALFLLAVYRSTISGLLSAPCRFQPTCSCYAQVAFTHYPPGKAFLLTLRRLLKCHPFGPFGFDPVPLENARKTS